MNNRQTLQVIEYQNSNGVKSTGRVYNQAVSIYSESINIPVVANCFAYTFLNIGDTDAFVNGMIIKPSATPATDLGDFGSIVGHEGDIYKGNLELSFKQPVNSNPQVQIVQLYYAESYSK